LEYVTSIKIIQKTIYLYLSLIISYQGCLISIPAL